ncbi:MAG TPA: hypothetical protein VFH89_04235 [Sphingomicrobium sp.]|nr:hypothetical protein [Sphingomicrobium sp.]
MTSNTTSEEAKLPSGSPVPEAISGFEVHKLYLETAKWLLAITTGLLVFGMDRLEAQVGSIMFVSFAVSALCLTISAGFNLFFLLQSFNFLSRRVKTGDPKNKDVEKALRLGGIAYKLTITAFIFGIVFYVPFQAAAIIKSSLKHAPVTLEKGPADFLIARQGQCLWALRPTDAKPHWVRLPGLNTQRCPDHP